MFWIGIDVGGTFTDIVMYDEKAQLISVAKTASVPEDPTKGVLAGKNKLGIDLVKVKKIVHGMTIGTNTVLERKGTNVSVITTQGFRDVLEIGRTNRSILYNIKTLAPRPLVIRNRIYEVKERTLFDGTIHEELDKKGIEGIIKELRDSHADSVAICFLHSYINPSHEEEARRMIENALPDLFISTSSEVHPEFREYERFNTTVLNAYIGPKVSQYLKKLKASLADEGYFSDLFVITSSGGIMTLDKAARLPVNTILSGPAGGVAGAAFIAELSGYKDIITYDMGGTSTDVCLMKDLNPSMSTEGSVEGLPNKIPQLDIITIGAGGGSICWIDAGHVLKVGPQSAGAVPGPACYGMGGADPTITDANLVLNRLSPKMALAGEIYLDKDLARKAIQKVAEQFPGIDEWTVAEGIIKIAVIKMTGAIKQISISRGYDPRDFILLAFGGAGPMHANQIANELDIHKIIIPKAPGNFSAFGSMISNLRHDYVKTRIMQTRKSEVETIKSIFSEMEDEAKAELAKEGIPEEKMNIFRTLGMRLVGQSFELNVSVRKDFESLNELEKGFHEAYRRRYSYCDENAESEIVNFRLSGVGETLKPVLTVKRTSSRSIPEALIERREVYFDGGFKETPVYQRDLIPEGGHFKGPAICEELGSTVVILPGYFGFVDTMGNIIIEREK